MAVKFKAGKRFIPGKEKELDQYYARIESGDEVSFEELADLISKISSLNYGEVMGAIGAFIEVIQMQLMHGRQVNLHTLGSFYLTLQSEGRNSKEEVTKEAIKGARVRFKPGSRLKSLLGRLEYEKVG